MRGRGRPRPYIAVLTRRDGLLAVRALQYRCITLLLIIVLSSTGVLAQTDTPPVTPANADALQRVQTLSGHTATINDIAFSPDGTQLASASDDITTRLSDVATGETEWTLEGQLTQVRSVAFSPDGNTVLTTGFTGTAFLWDVRSRTRGRSIEALAAFNDGVFSPDGEAIALAIGDGSVRLYALDTLDVVQTLTAPDTLQITAIAYHHDGDSIAGGTGFPSDSVLVWDIDSGEVVSEWTAHTSTVYGVAYSPDGARLASVGGDGQLIVWDVESGEAIFTVEAAHGGGAFDVAYSPDGVVLATVGFDGALRLWDSSDGTALAEVIADDARSLLAVAFSPDGGTIATAGEAATVDLWRNAE